MVPRMRALVTRWRPCWAFLPHQGHRHRQLDGGQRGFESFQVRVTQAVFIHAADAGLVGAAAGLRRVVLAGLDAADDHVRGAQLADLLQGMPFGAFADGQHGDHGADAQDRAQHGQQAAQLVEQQIADGELQDFQPHEFFTRRDRGRGLGFFRRTRAGALLRLGSDLGPGVERSGDSSTIAIGFRTTRSPAFSPSRICTNLSLVRPSWTCGAAECPTGRCSTRSGRRPGPPPGRER